MSARSIPEIPPSVAVLTPAVWAGALHAHEVQLCAAVRRLVPDVSDDEVRALALCARAVRTGHSCIDLAAEIVVLDARDEQVVGLVPDDRVAWRASLESSSIVRVATPDASTPDAGTPDASTPEVGAAVAPTEPPRPLVLDGTRLYLDRWWHHERTTAAALRERALRSVPVDAAVQTTVLDALFGPDDPADPDLQRRGAVTITERALAVIAGGPGTGKTRTIARSLAAVAALAEHAGAPMPTVVLCAPTGKAAQRMTESIRAATTEAVESGAVSAAVGTWLGDLEAVTIHAALGAHPMRGFSRNARSPMRADLVIVDEVSMVSLSLLAHLLDAMPGAAHLVLVGDPDQLVSIDAGSVAADIVDAAADATSPLHVVTTVLQRARRFGDDSGIGQLARALRSGDADAVVACLEAGSDDVSWVDPADNDAVAAVRATVEAEAERSVACAAEGDADGAVAAALATKVLCVTREHAGSVSDWNDRIAAAMATVQPESAWQRWWVGRPVLVTENDRINKVSNGDVGVVVAGPDGPVVAIADGVSTRALAPARLGDVATWWAMTIHKSQGSEFDHVVVSLPEFDTPILTRELLYTAVTRARRRLTLIGDEATLRAAVEARVERASGLPERLRV